MERGQSAKAKTSSRQKCLASGTRKVRGAWVLFAVLPLPCSFVVDQSTDMAVGRAALQVVYYPTHKAASAQNTADLSIGRAQVRD
eukprot:3105615-Amphidinium_carterae.1